MSDLIEPRIDVYGGKARRSALADFAELWAMRGDAPSVARIGDYIKDNNWLRKTEELYEEHVPPPEDEDEDDDESDLPPDETTAGEVVFDILRQREVALGDRYPFQIEDETRLVPKPVHDGAAYLALQGLTVAHAYKLEVPSSPEDTFEESVTLFLRDLGLTAVNFSRIRNDSAGFQEAVVEAGAQLALHATPEVGIVSKRANDENVDAVAHLDLRDDRESRVVLIGQATCGVSDTWDAKLMEASDNTWCGLLGLAIPPLAFLAIPHHVERRFFAKLIQDRRRHVFDRLTMTLARGAPSAEEQAIADAVSGAEVVPLD